MAAQATQTDDCARTWTIYRISEKGKDLKAQTRYTPEKSRSDQSNRYRVRSATTPEPISEQSDQLLGSDSILGSVVGSKLELGWLNGLWLSPNKPNWARIWFGVNRFNRPVQGLNGSGRFNMGGATLRRTLVRRRTDDPICGFCSVQDAEHDGSTGNTNGRLLIPGSNGGLRPRVVGGVELTGRRAVQGGRRCRPRINGGQRLERQRFGHERKGKELDLSGNFITIMSGGS
ncbi:hypothetical protein GQ457_16G016020 [Hibiscus cannabinus]